MAMIDWKTKPNGNCPVQADGYFLGYYFYFRARGFRATIEFSLTEAGWHNDLIHGRYNLWETRDPYSAGWLPTWFCELLVYWGCVRFLFKRKKMELV